MRISIDLDCQIDI